MKDNERPLSMSRWGQNLVCRKYSKFSKISNTFLFLFSNKIMFVRAGIRKILVRIANREEPDQTASEEAV